MKVAPRFGTGHRILVTGGAGFVPSHLVDRLVERGCDVVVLDNFVTGSKDNVAHLLDKPTFTLVEADISDGLPQHPAMTERFDAILAKQMPDAEKRKRAHFVVDSGRGHASAEAQVRSILASLAGRPGRVAPPGPES